MTSVSPIPDVECSLWIARSPEDIWEYWYGVTNETKWRAGVISAQWLSDPPHGVGSTGLHIVQGVGDWPWRVVECEEPRSMSWVVTGGRFEGARAGYRVAPDDSGSRVTIHMRAKRCALMSIVMLFMKRAIKHQLAGDLERLKALMES